MTDEKTVTMTVTVLNKLLRLNADAVSAVSPVGGNNIQSSYRDHTLRVLDEQKTLLEVFVPEGD